MHSSVLVSLCLVVAVAVVVNAEGEQVCSPGSTFKKGCESCQCADDGLNYTCIPKQCPRERKAPECTEGEVKQENCNSCRCSKGGRWVCTQKACLT